MSENLLEINDLHVIYKTDLETVYAVNGVSLNIERGETVGIVGETGAGKTTTALAILRLLPSLTGKITEGSINFDGLDVMSLREGDLRAIRGARIAMIFQDPMTSLNPVVPVGEQIAEALILHNTEKRSKSEIQKRVDETLELVGIPSFRKTDYPHQFSGGMKQRVVIAMALACEPELLIADEPTTALDVTIQAQVLAMMRDLKKKLNMSMIMITHDLGIVAMTCDKVAVMYAGEIIEYGTAEDIFDSGEHHPYTIGLFGSIPDLEGGADRLSPIVGLMPDPTDLPRGCKFQPRCPSATDICREIQPADVFVKEHHRIKCHNFTDAAIKASPIE